MAEYNSAHTGAEIDAAIQKYLDGNIYQVTNAEVYSQEEQMIGTWIDGKPIYRKVWMLTLPSAVMVITPVIDISGLSVDSVITLRGVTSVGTDTIALPFSGPTNGTSAGNAVYFQIQFSVNQISFMTTLSGYSGAEAVCILEYTKTTDEPAIATVSVDELDDAYGEGVQSA